jgi:protein-S-isoprenylcysteine O-methyltransferase Ste14
LLLVWLFVRLLSVVQIAPEEAALYMTFGRDYQEYSRQVNRWFGRRNRATRNY